MIRLPIPDNQWTPVSEVHIVEILGEYGKEVGVLSIRDPLDTSFVVISRETERFVNEIRKSSIKRKFPLRRQVCLAKRKRKLQALRKLGRLLALGNKMQTLFSLLHTSRTGGYLAMLISKAVTPMCRHFDQEER